jgi:hypothetical protein
VARYAFFADGRIDAPASAVYATLANYNVGHQAVLPRPPFIAMTVDKGGVGAGTVVTTSMKLLGRVQTFTAEIDEPVPGRLLRETVPASKLVTTFEVEPLGPASCRLTIRTEIPVLWGPLGRLQGGLAARLLLPVYREEIGRVAAYAAAHPA